MFNKIKSRYRSEELAISLLEGSGIRLIDAVILALDLIRECGGKGNKLKRARKGIYMGAEALKSYEKTVTFEHAVQETLASKRDRRPRTLQDIRYVMGRLLRECPELGKRHISCIKTSDCQEYLDKSFHSLRQRFKARVLLHGVFVVAKKRGWCRENPVEGVEVPYVAENRIRALTLDEVMRLREAVFMGPELKQCGPALGVMLYAGIRPAETRRLRWRDIDLRENVINVMPNHSKTGGSRHVTIYPVLKHWLDQFPHGLPEDTICPVYWELKWKKLRAVAGWGNKPGLQPWIQDCLRHTFASYHAKYFKSFDILQIEMGHFSSALLRTRYLNMEGVTSENAEIFWNME